MADRTPSTRSSARSSSAPRGIARHGNLHPHPWATFGKVVASVAVVAVVSVLGIAGVAAANLVSDTKKSVHLVGEKAGAIPDIGAIDGGVNILIAATDTRSDQGGEWGTTDDSSGAGLNDVTMLLHLSQDHTHAEVISFPRDLMVAIPKCPDGDGGWNSAMSKQQINTTLEDGGLACTVLTVEQLTGLKIPFAGLITFDGVVSMSNAVGGVPVCIANGGIHDSDTDLDLPEGTVNLQGVQAAQFLRTRHGVGDGSDLSRISNQQVFLSSLVRTIMSNGTLTNPVKVWGLAKAATQNVQLSDSLNNVTTLYQIALALKGLDWSKISFIQYPTLSDPDDSNRVVPDDESAQTLMDALSADQPIAITGGTGGGDDGSVVSTDQPAQQPSATPTPTKSSKADKSTTSSSKSSATSSPSATSAPVDLGANVHGQTAATQTCSNGNN